MRIKFVAILNLLSIFIFLASCSPSKISVEEQSTQTFLAKSDHATQTSVSLAATRTQVFVEYLEARTTATQSTPNPPSATPIAPLSSCPVGDPGRKPDFSDEYAERVPHLGEPILEFLNSGGTVQAVIDTLRWTDEQGLFPDKRHDYKIESKDEYNKTHLFEQDLTGDGIPEFIVSRVNLFIFGCRNGLFEILMEVKNEWYTDLGTPSPWIITIGDLNSNYTAEIIVKSYHMRTGTQFRVYEWQSDKFASLLISEPTSYLSNPDFHVPDAVTIGNGEVILEDINDDGKTDIIIRGYDTSLFTRGLPSRGEQYTYLWNGTNYMFYTREYSPPIYRFEAVQDGDRYSLTGEYDKAIKSYRDAIFNDELDWWSDERNRYEVVCFIEKPDCAEIPTPPSPDPKEYENLAAYSRFRLILIDILLGQYLDAEMIYTKWQDRTMSGQAGYMIAEMAREFWVEYQQSNDIGAACDKAVAFAEAYPEEILSYLGNGEFAVAYYGEQSLDYSADDVCPFE